MLDFEEARKIILNVARADFLSAQERVSVGSASGRVLSEEVVSPVQVPGADYSAMDGYAVNSADFGSSGDLTLPVVGECQTGHPTVAMSAGQVVRIFTGAAIPPGADAVVMQENVTRTGESVTIHQAARAGDNIRRAGEDLQKGASVLTPGTRLSGFQLGLLASVERTEVVVALKPRCLVLCTGDELRPPGSAWSEGQLAESNSVALCALIESAGGQALRAPLVRDDKETMKAALLAAQKHADVIVTVGGVSVGDHDVVEPALRELGANVRFHKVKIKPGKPVLFASWGNTLVLGLPGNPSSAQVTFSLFGYPLLRALQGDAAPIPAERRATLKGDFRQKSGRRGFYRARLVGDSVEIFPNQASGASTSIAWANALVVLGEDVEQVPDGSQVSIIAYSDL